MKRRQEWAGRILVESNQHPASSFVTLTYEDEELTYGAAGIPTLYPHDATLFLKRLRHQLPFRYFLVGEYGDLGRPHFHLVLFGTDNVYNENLIQDTWKKGFITVSELTTGRAKYVARYTMKKQSTPSNTSDGLVSEYATMSRKPGLGFSIIPKIVASLTQCGYHANSGRLIGSTQKHKPLTMPECYRHQKGKWPLSATMKRHLNKLLNVPREDLSKEVIDMTNFSQQNDYAEIYKAVREHETSAQLSLKKQPTQI